MLVLESWQWGLHIGMAVPRPIVTRQPCQTRSCIARIATTVALQASNNERYMYQQIPTHAACTRFDPSRQVESNSSGFVRGALGVGTTQTARRRGAARAVLAPPVRAWTLLCAAHSSRVSSLCSLPCVSCTRGTTSRTKCMTQTRRANGRRYGTHGTPRTPHRYTLSFGRFGCGAGGAGRRRAPYRPFPAIDDAGSAQRRATTYALQARCTSGWDMIVELSISAYFEAYRDHRT